MARGRGGNVIPTSRSRIVAGFWPGLSLLLLFSPPFQSLSSVLLSSVSAAVAVVRSTACSVDSAAPEFVA